MSLIAGGNTDPGRLDRRVTLAQPVTTRDAVGGAIVEWVDAATVWAERRAARQARQFAAEGKQYVADLTYRLRHRDDVAGGWRLIDGTKVFEVVDLLPLGREHLLELGVRGLNDTATETMADFIASLVGYHASSNSSGTTTITPTARRLQHQETTTISGSGSTTRLLVLAVSPTPPTGATLVHRIVCPATAEITLEWRNATAGGTLLTSALTDGSGDDMVAEFVFNGTAWAFVRFASPANA